MNDRAKESEAEDVLDSQGEMTFVEHLVELRNRLLRVVIVVAILLLCLMPFANRLYALLAAPLLAEMQMGSSMIATQVASPFLTPFKLALVAGDPHRDALHPVPVLGVRRSGTLPAGEAARLPAHGLQLAAVLPRDGVRLLRGVSAHVRVLPGRWRRKAWRS